MIRQLSLIPKVNKYYLLDKNTAFGINEVYNKSNEYKVIHDFMCWHCTVRTLDNNVKLDLDFVNKNVKIKEIFSECKTTTRDTSIYNMKVTTYYHNVHILHCKIDYYCIHCGYGDSTRFTAKIPLEYIKLF